MPPPSAASHVATNLDLLLQDALRLHQGGRPGEAESRYRQILAQEPRHADALHYLGLLAYSAKRYDTAARLIGESIAVRPGNAAASSNLGNALVMLGRLAEAEAAFRDAQTQDPQLADASFNLGNVLRQQQKLPDAQLAYRRAMAQNPNHAGALANLAHLLVLQQRPGEAAAAFLHLGNLLQDHGRTGEAANAYRQSLALAPDPGVEVQLAFLTPVIPVSVADIDRTRERLYAGIADLRAREIRLADPLRYASSALFYTGYQGRNDRDLRRAFADFHLAVTPGLAWRAPHCADYRGPGKKIRVGFVSRFLYPEHPIGKYYSAIIDKLDRERFDVAEFRYTPTTGEPGVARAQTVLPRDDLAAARQRVAAARLDVLFYPDVGMDPATYFLAFARLAPVQCVTLGHPVTTGIPAMDYFLSAEGVEPAEAAEHYSETLIRLADVPNFFRRHAPSGAAPTRADFGLPAEAMLYACGQNPIKIHPEFDAVLAEILRRDPNGLLVLFNGDKTPRWGELLMERFRATMGDVANRVVFLPFLKLDAWLGFLRGVDAALDTPHFGGGTTSLEMFAVGIPIVTWPGVFARSRQTAALYRRMQVAGPVAENAAQYVDLALRLAHDAPWRAQLQGELRQRCPVLYENMAAVRELQEFFTAAVAAAAQGRKLGPAAAESRRSGESAGRDG